MQSRLRVATDEWLCRSVPQVCGRVTLILSPLCKSKLVECIEEECSPQSHSQQKIEIGGHETPSSSTASDRHRAGAALVVLVLRGTLRGRGGDNKHILEILLAKFQ